MTQTDDEVLSHRLPEQRRAANTGVGRPRWVGYLALGIAILALGAAVGWSVRGASAQPAGTNVLDHWDELPSADLVDQGSTVRDGDTRFLGEIDGDSFYGTLGTGMNGFFDDQVVVCLDVRREDRSGVGSCAPRHAFERNGLWVSGSSSGWRANYAWNAYSPPMQVTCASDDWLRSCPVG